MRVAIALLFLVAPALWLPAGVAAQCCALPDNGGGTVDLPPACQVGYNGPMRILDGLTPDATIEIDATITDIINTNEVPGGDLGGTIATFDATLFMQMVGTGDLAGFNRFIAMAVDGEIHFGPRNPGDAVQSFAGSIFRLDGALAGDPDFDLLEVRTGTSYGLPSPGQTTLTRVGPPGSDFEVDSFFDIEYQITFSGQPGSVLQDKAGTTQLDARFGMCSDEPVPAEDTSWGRVKGLYR